MYISVEIYIHRSLEKIKIGQVFEESDRGEACVIDQHVQTTKFLDRFIDQDAALIRAGDIGWDGKGFAAAASIFGGDLIQAVFAPGGQNNPGVLVSKL
jgi:hypothetical protein